MIRSFFSNYLERHLHPVNLLLHVVGVPLTFVGTPVFLIRQNWPLALACFLGGYALQFIGHAIEGNDAGETVLVKKLLGRPYTIYGPTSKYAGTEDSKSAG